MMSKLLLSLTILLASLYKAQAQYQPQSVWGARVHYGTIFVHSDSVKNVGGNSPRGFEIEMARQWMDTAFKSKYGCYPRTGWSLSYFDYNTPILGQVLNLGYYIQPVFILNNRWQWYYKVGLGFGYLSSPYNAETHPDNHSYSLHWNASLQISTGFNYHINKYYSLTAAANFLHNSNGCTNSPNRGVNYPGISLGIEYQPAGNTWKNYTSQRSHIPHWYNSTWHGEVNTFAGIKHIQNYYYGEKNIINYGLKAKLIKQYNSFNTFSIGAEICYDNELRVLNNAFGFNNSNYLLAIMLGHEFIFPHWIVSTEFGYYIYKEINDTHQRWAFIYPFLHHWQISYKIDNHWLIGSGLKAHNQIADFVDLHLGYRW